MKSALTFILLCFLTALAFASGQPLSSSKIPKESLEYPIGLMSPDKRLHLAIELPGRDQAQLDQFLKDLYDPKSPEFKHYLTPQEFTERFGATQADYDAVVLFFKDQGFKVTTFSDRKLLDIDGPVKMIEACFHTTLRLYKHPTEDRNFYAPDANPTVDIAIPLLGIQGLDDFHRFRPILKDRSESKVPLST